MKLTTSTSVKMLMEVTNFSVLVVTLTTVGTFTQRLQFVKLEKTQSALCLTILTTHSLESERQLLRIASELLNSSVTLINFALDTSHQLNSVSVLT
jgi:transcriptional regulator of heat shock response